MFSFRTTPVEEQLDRSLREGRVACFCTQNCWDPHRGRYLYDIFRERGNLERIFSICMTFSANAATSNASSARATPS